MSNYAQWDSQLFYLHNDDRLFPTYTGWLIKARPDIWNYGVIKNHQSQLRPLLDALKHLREEGLTTALVLSAVHHCWVLTLMSRPLRMDEMGPCTPSRDLEACQMSRAALSDKEVAARVRAAVSSNF
jgi:hypothetical protein